MKKILIDATGSSGWIGGVYHKKNILFSLLQNEWISSNCSIVLVTNPEHVSVFKEFEDRVRIRTVSFKGVREKKLKLAFIAFVNRCRYAFPNFDPRICRMLHISCINWVPDYQHYHYPEFFSDEELESRKYVDRQTYDTGYPLVLSSEACLDDFRQFCSKNKENIYIVPFVSYIEKDVRSITEEYLKTVCDRYGLIPGRYIMTANQFWQHKNHKVVLEALTRITDRCDTDLKLAFTGQLSDYRANEYIELVKAMLADPKIKDRCVCTGFIDRKEQLALMKGAAFLIQPSLFEGWGTVLEDAKVLDKTVLLSDIPVHREQMNDKCTLFDPHDAGGLGQLILEKWNCVEPDDSEAGIRRMYESALSYSTGFERLLKEN